MARLLTTAVLVAFLCSLLHEIEAFSSRSAIPASLLAQSSSLLGSNNCLQRPSTAIYATDDDNDDDDDDDDDGDDDDEMDSSDLGDWRKFRASLIDGEEDFSSSPQAAKKKSVAVQNEALLEQQNKELAAEYRSGVWAHTIGQPEVGGLLCRMPIEAEIFYHGTGHWKEKLDIMVSLDDNDVASSSETITDEDPGLLGYAKVNR
jgi:hypothetical protein